MDFIYILKLTDRYDDPNNWNDETNQILDQHWNYLVDLHAKGVMQLVGRTSYAPGHKDLFGIAVFSAESDAKAQEIMDNDPCIVHNVMTAAVHPFNLSLIAGKPHLS